APEWRERVRRKNRVALSDVLEGRVEHARGDRARVGHQNGTSWVTQLACTSGRSAVGPSPQMSQTVGACRSAARRRAAVGGAAVAGGAVATQGSGGPFRRSSSAARAERNRRCHRTTL